MRAASRVALSMSVAQRCEVSSSLDWLRRYEACMIVSSELLKSWAKRRSSVLMSEGILELGAQRWEVSSSLDWVRRDEACNIVSSELLKSWAKRRSSVLMSEGILEVGSICVCADILTFRI